jgi:death-on-curing protein
MIYLTVAEVIELHEMLVVQSGGGSGIRERGGLESAVAQPKMTFGGVDLYPSLEEKAAALAFSLVMNHPFVDGNKRIGHAAMEVFLVLNGQEIAASVDEQEEVFLKLAAGGFHQNEFTDWVKSHVVVK